MKNASCFIIIFLCPLLIRAQKVISSTGGSGAGNSIEMNWTIGEVAIATLSSNKSASTSGFNQPVIQIITSIENMEIGISVFPNPTTQYLNIHVEGQLPITAKFISPLGIVVSAMDLTNQTTQIDFSRYDNGIYILEINDATGRKNLFKVIKN